MLPLLLLSLHILPNVYTKPILALNPLERTPECRLSPEAPPKVYHWTPKAPVNLWELAGRFQGDLVGPPSQQVLSRGQRCVLKEGVDYWPEAIVPVDIGQGFAWTEMKVLKKALNIIEEKTCIRFPPRQANHTSYVELKGDLGYGECWSYLGRLSGNQTLSLGEGCVNLHHALHEICHALGMVHQHSAPDRDDYINIHWENIDPDFVEWFDKYTWDEYTDFGLGYDYYSVMHYSQYIASKNGKPTISAKDPKVKIEARTTLSEKDVQKLNMMYCSGDTYVRQFNYRTFGGYIADLVNDLSPLTRHMIALLAAVWLLLVTSLVGNWLFSRLLVRETDPDDPELGKALEVAKESYTVKDISLEKEMAKGRELSKKMERVVGKGTTKWMEVGEKRSNDNLIAKGSQMTEDHKTVNEIEICNQNEMATEERTYGEQMVKTNETAENNTKVTMKTLEGTVEGKSAKEIEIAKKKTNLKEEKGANDELMTSQYKEWTTKKNIGFGIEPIMMEEERANGIQVDNWKEMMKEDKRAKNNDVRKVLNTTEEDESTNNNENPKRIDLTRENEKTKNTNVGKKEEIAKEGEMALAKYNELIKNIEDERNVLTNKKQIVEENMAKDEKEMAKEKGVEKNEEGIDKWKAEIVKGVVMEKIEAKEKVGARRKRETEEGSFKQKEEAKERLVLNKDEDSETELAKETAMAKIMESAPKQNNEANGRVLREKIETKEKGLTKEEGDTNDKEGLVNEEDDEKDRLVIEKGENEGDKDAVNQTGGPKEIVIMETNEAEGKIVASGKTKVKDEDALVKSKDMAKGKGVRPDEEFVLKQKDEAKGRVVMEKIDAKEKGVVKGKDYAYDKGDIVKENDYTKDRLVVEKDDLKERVVIENNKSNGELVMDEDEAKDKGEAKRKCETKDEQGPVKQNDDAKGLVVMEEEMRLPNEKMQVKDEENFVKSKNMAKENDVAEDGVGSICMKDAAKSKDVRTDDESVVKLKDEAQEGMARGKETKSHRRRRRYENHMPKDKKQGKK